ITLFRGDSGFTFPGGLHVQPTHWDYYDRASWKLDVVGARTPVRLFDPGRDAANLAFTRIGDAGRRGLFRVTVSEVTGQPVFHFDLPVDARGWSPPDYTASLVIADRIKARQETMGGAAALRVRLRREDAGDVAVAPGKYGVVVESIILGFGRLTGQGSPR